MTPEVEKQQFREAMSRLGAAVNIVTTLGPAGKGGFSATAVCSVTDTPATLLVCVNHSASVFNTVISNGRLCVNTLAADQTELALHFGGKLSTEERFAAGDWRLSPSGMLTLAGALLACECEVSQWQDVGTHRVLFCKVTRIDISEREVGLVYFNRRFVEVKAA